MKKTSKKATTYDWLGALKSSPRSVEEHRKATRKIRKQIGEKMQERINYVKRTFKSSAKEKNRYVLSEERDFEILSGCNELQQQKLSKNNREFINLIKSQLEEDWRTPLLAKLKQIEKKYRRTK